jgi:hypothetical protein
VLAILSDTAGKYDNARMTDEQSNPPNELSTPKAEHVTVNRRDGSNVGPEISDQFSAGNYGCLGAISIWTFGWVAIAFLAISRVWRSPDGSALLGAVVAAMVALTGSRFSLALLRQGRSATRVNISFFVSKPRRAFGWLIVLLLLAAALFWNLAVFLALIRTAKAGHGWTMLFLTIWSVAGLFALYVVFTGTGVTIDNLRRGSGR